MLVVTCWTSPAWTQSASDAGETATAGDAGTGPAPVAGSDAATSPAPEPVAPVATVAPPAVASRELMVAVVDAAPLGVEAAAATYVTETLRLATTAAGRTPVPTQELYEVARRLGLGFPVPPDGLLAAARELSVPIALTADVRAGGGFYIVRVRARFAQEIAERTREVVATQWTLGDAVRAAVPELLAAERRPIDPSTMVPGVTMLPDAGDYQPPRPRRPPRLHPQALELSLGFQFTLGPGSDSFWNFLGTARATWFPFDRFGMSVMFGYANLRGRTLASLDQPIPSSRDGRVSNVVFAVGAETAIDIAPRQRIYLPIHGEVGYVPYNGPVLRGGAGLGFTLSREVRLEIDLLGVSVWILPDGVPVTLDLGAQIRFGVGATTRRAVRRTN